MVKKREFLGRWRKDKTGLLVWKWKKRKPTKYVAPLIGEYEVGRKSVVDAILALQEKP